MLRWAAAVGVRGGVNVRGGGLVYNMATWVHRGVVGAQNVMSKRFQSQRQPHIPGMVLAWCGVM